MTTYLVLKWIHILSSVLMVGTGFGSAFYLWCTQRTGNVSAIAVVARLVVKADNAFTLPAALIQPATGFSMALIAGYSLHQTWLLASVMLYLIAGLSWLPVLYLQLRMAALAEEAALHGQSLPASYWRDARHWTWLGAIGFSSMLAIYGLMVFKPGG